MKIAAKTGVFALALILSALPTMACLLPTATLTTAERECCKRMASECGQEGMPSSHSCCRRLAGPEDNLIKTPSAQIDHIASSTYVSVANAPLLLNGLPLVQTGLDFDLHGPPDSPPTTIFVLRI